MVNSINALLNQYVIEHLQYFIDTKITDKIQNDVEINDIWKNTKVCYPYSFKLKTHEFMVDIQNTQDLFTDANNVANFIATQALHYMYNDVLQQLWEAGYDNNLYNLNVDHSASSNFDIICKNIKSAINHFIENNPLMTPKWILTDIVTAILLQRHPEFIEAAPEDITDSNNDSISYIGNIFGLKLYMDKQKNTNKRGVLVGCLPNDSKTVPGIHCYLQTDYLNTDVIRIIAESTQRPKLMFKINYDIIKTGLYYKPYIAFDIL